MIDMLADDDTQIRESAAEYLVEIKSKKAVPYLVEALYEGKNDWAIRSLLKMTDSRGEKNGILRRVANNYSTLDGATIEMLAQFFLFPGGPVEAMAEIHRRLRHSYDIPALRERLNDPGADSRADAVDLLASTLAGEAVDILLEHGTDPSPVVRAKIAWALGFLQSAKAIKPLLAMTLDEDADVRKAAHTALGKLYVGQDDIRKFYLERLRREEVKAQEVRFMDEGVVHKQDVELHGEVLSSKDPAVRDPFIKFWLADDRHVDDLRMVRRINIFGYAAVHGRSDEAKLGAISRLEDIVRNPAENI